MIGLRPWFRHLAAGTTCILLASCGGSEPSAPETPQVETVAVSPGTATIAVGETQTFTALVTDQNGDVLTGRTITWNSSASAVATISSSGVATGAGEGQATITATVEGVQGTATLTVELADFAPTSDTQIAGSVTYASVDIPEGVTVEVTGDLVLTVMGDVALAGSLEGDCVEISLESGGEITLNGAINNSCSADDGTNPGLTIVGNGALSIDGSHMSSSGAIDIANAPDLPPIGAIAKAAAGGGPLPQTAGPFPCDIINYTVVTGVKAPSGLPGQNGTPGWPGYGFIFACDGNLSFRGNVQIQTEAGGDGGNGTDMSATAASATGGAGGDGGILVLRAFGDMSFTDEAPGEIPNQFFSGAGGAGGTATATGQANQAPAQAPGATAGGGAGGAAGAVSLEVQGVLSFAPESFFAGAGTGTSTGGPVGGGAGGMATAVAADGADATTRGDVAQKGGDASATGGTGGDAPGFLFVALEDVVGEENMVFDDAVDGGTGGTADATGGMGGDGDQPHKPGAMGGAVHSAGGDGGDAGSGFGGTGGDAVFRGGMGGMGWNDCVLPTYEEGGRGGDGGNATGGDGTPGAGLNPGLNGRVDTDAVSNGGDGGDGEDPGEKGDKGTDGIVTLGTRNEIGGGSFQDGVAGNHCADKSGTYNITVTVGSDPAGHNPFVGLTGVTEIQIAVETGSGSEHAISFSGSAPWVTVSGTWSAETFEFEASGSGTVAGYANIFIQFTGTLTCNNVLEGQYVMGVSGGLPGGIPITYLVQGSFSSAGAPRLGFTVDGRPASSPCSAG